MHPVGRSEASHLALRFEARLASKVFDERPNAYGAETEGYVERADAATLVEVQIETAEAVADLLEVRESRQLLRIGDEFSAVRETPGPRLEVPIASAVLEGSRISVRCVRRFTRTAGGSTRERARLR